MANLLDANVCIEAMKRFIGMFFVRRSGTS